MGIKFYYAKADELIDDFDAAVSRISPYRRNKIDSCRNEKDKRLSLAATLLLDKALSDYGLCERDMSYKVNEYGKPYFSDFHDIHFSISHSGEYALVAVSDSEIGCDIQHIKAVENKIADRFFTPSESKYVNETNDFFRVWVLKESFIKAIGRGLSVPLDSFEISDLDTKPFVIYNNEKYIFEEYNLDDYKMAICTLL